MTEGASDQQASGSQHITIQEDGEELEVTVSKTGTGAAYADLLRERAEELMEVDR